MFEFSLAQQRFVGWRPCAVASYVNGCGHAQEFIPIPEGKGRCFNDPVLGEAP